MNIVVDKNIGMVGYFPWAISVPRADWVPDDDKRYLADVYPQADDFYQSQNKHNYRVGQNMTSKDKVDGFEASTSSDYGTEFLGWKAFQKNKPLNVSDCWMSLKIPAADKPQSIGLTMEKQKHFITKIELVRRFGGTYFPKTVKINVLGDDELWHEVTNSIDLLNEETATILIPEEKQVWTSGVRLDIYSAHGNNVVAIGRMKIFAKGINAPLITKDMGGYAVVPNTNEWYLRVGKKVE